MNWDELVPEKIAINQRAWERRRAIWRMRELGFKFHEIGARFNVHEVRAGQLYHKAQDDRCHGLSPVEVWLADEDWLAGFWKELDHRSRAMVAHVARARAKAREQEAREKFARAEIQRHRRMVETAERALADAREALAWVEQEYGGRLEALATTTDA